MASEAEVAAEGSHRSTGDANSPPMPTSDRHDLSELGGLPATPSGDQVPRLASLL